MKNVGKCPPWKYLRGAVKFLLQRYSLLSIIKLIITYMNQSSTFPLNISPTVTKTLNNWSVFFVLYPTLVDNLCYEEGKIKWTFSKLFVTHFKSSQLLKMGLDSKDG